MPLVYPFIIFVLWAIFFLPVLAGNSTMFEDVLEQNYPNFYYLTQNLKEGILPFFNHKIFSSIHFLHDPQVFNLNPTAILRYGMGLFDNSLHIFLIGLAISYLLAGLFMYIYLRRRFSPEISLFGAVVYMFSLGYIVVFIHNFAVDSLWVLPLIMMAVEREDWRFSALAGVLIGFMLFAGHPQIPIYTLIIFALYFLMFRRWRGLLFFLLGTAPFFLAYYFAFIDVVRDSPRLHYTLEQLLEISYYPKYFVQLLIPKFFGALEPGSRYVGGPYYFYIEITHYFSLAGLILAILGAWRRFSESSVRFIVVAVLISIFFALGRSNPLVVALYKTGLFSGIRNPSRYMYLVAFFVPILGAYGLDYFLSSAKRAFRDIIYITGGIIAVALFYIMTFSGMPPVEGELFKFFVILALLLILFYGFFRNSISSSLFLYSIIGLTFVDLYLAGNPYLRWKVDVDRFYYPPIVARFKQDKGLFRINARFNRGMALPRNSGMVNGLELTEGYNPMMPLYYSQIYEYVLRRQEGFENLLAMMNVRYYISDKGFRRLREYPRAYVVYGVEYYPDSAQFFKHVADMDFSSTAYVQENVGGKYSPGGMDPCRFIRYDAGIMIMECNARRDGFLFVSRSYQRLLRAKVDGKPVRVVRSNWGFSGLPLTSGKHRVELYMDSSGLKLSVLLFLLGMLWPLFFFGVRREA